MRSSSARLPGLLSGVAASPRYKMSTHRSHTLSGLIAASLWLACSAATNTLAVTNTKMFPLSPLLHSM